VVAVVFGRGLVAGALCGAVPGVLVATLLAGPWGAIYGLWFGGIAGLAVGVVAAAALVVLRPAIRTDDGARLAGLLAAALGGAAFAVVVITGPTWYVVLTFALVCAAIGSGVGRWVVFGSKRSAGERTTLRRGA
jgi:hypothetical protein